jgi:leucyl-tRNA synthetase
LQVENEGLRKQVQELQRQLAAQSQATASAVNESKETERLLHAQLQAYKEDFESERKDRETAQAKLINLEAEMAKAKQQVILKTLFNLYG